jgi:hypothetical protein
LRWCLHFTSRTLPSLFLLRPVILLLTPPLLYV